MKTDAQLEADIMTELHWEPIIHAAQIKVVAKNGIATLSGSVPNFAEKLAAEKAAQRVEGVKAITEELVVEVSEFHRRKDTEIAKSVVDVLRWHVLIPSEVKVVVENGCVTLSGEVTWAFQRHSAEDAIRYQWGVKNVVNNITLLPSIKSSAVKSELEQALKANSEPVCEHNKIHDDGGAVTLAGPIDKKIAKKAAWMRPGTTGAETDMVVE